MSGLVRRDLVRVGTCSARSALCRDVLYEVVFVSVRVRGVRLCVATFSAKLGCVSGLVRRGLLSFETCSSRSG